MKKVISIIFILFLMSCNNKKSCKCETTFEKFNDSIISTLKNYNHSFNKNRKLKDLQLFKCEVYRIKTMYSFNRYCQSYTFMKTKNGAKLEVIQYNKKPDKNVENYNIYEKYEVHKKYVIKLNQKQWEIIKNDINSYCFWTNKFGIGCPEVLDGNRTILEGFDPNKNNCSKRKYHFDISLNGHKSKIGDLCSKIRKYAKEENLMVE